MAGYRAVDGTFVVAKSAAGITGTISPGTLTPSVPQDILLWTVSSPAAAVGVPSNYSQIPGAPATDGNPYPWYYRYITGAVTPAVNESGSSTEAWATIGLLFSAIGSFVAAITNVSASAFVTTVTAANSFVAGDVIYFYSLTNATFLNGTTYVVTSATSSQFVFTNSTTANYSSHTDTGTATSFRVVQQSGIGGNPLATSGTVTFSNPITKGNLIVFLLNDIINSTTNLINVTGLTDNKSSSYNLSSQCEAASGSHDGCTTAMGYAFAAVSGIDTIMYTLSFSPPSGNVFGCTAYELAMAGFSSKSQCFFM